MNYTAEQLAAMRAEEAAYNRGRSLGYDEGYRAAQQEIRHALGIES